LPSLRSVMAILNTGPRPCTATDMVTLASAAWAMAPCSTQEGRAML